MCNAIFLGLKKCNGKWNTAPVSVDIEIVDTSIKELYLIEISYLNMHLNEIETLTIRA